MQLLFFSIFLQKGCRRPFWMSEIHFWSHFWPFQINTQLYFVFTKWPPEPILDVRNSLLFSFLAISDRYAIYIFRKFSTKWLPLAIFDVRNLLSIAFLAILDQYGFLFFLIFFTKWSIGHLDVWNSLSIAILAISDRYRNVFFGGHFGCPKITFDRISGHFRSIGHFGCQKFTLDGISGHFRSTRFIYVYFWQNGRRRPFWMGRQCQLLNSSEIFGWVIHVSSLKKFKKVIALTTKLWRGGRGVGGCVADENIIFPETCISREFNYDLLLSYCSHISHSTSLEIRHWTDHRVLGYRGLGVRHLHLQEYAGSWSRDKALYHRILITGSWSRDKALYHRIMITGLSWSGDKTLDHIVMGYRGLGVRHWTT